MFAGMLLVFSLLAAFGYLNRTAAEVRCELLLVRREILITSPGVGRLELLVAQGDRVPAGQLLARIHPLIGGLVEPLEIRSSQAGIFSLGVDGLETVLTPESWSSLRPEGLMQLNEAELVQVVNGEVVSQGQKLFKIVDSLSTVMLVGEWKEKGWNPAAGEKLWVRVQGTEEWLPAVVDSHDGLRIALRPETWRDQWLSMRKTVFEVRGGR